MRIIKLKIPILLILISIFWPQLANTQSALLPSSEYLGFIQERVNSYLIYPKEAIANDWEGIVKVKFILSRDGRIKEIDIAKSSGYPLLDVAAILAVKDASPYPFPKDYTGKEELEVILPVNYVQTKPKPSPPISLPTTSLKKPLPAQIEPEALPSITAQPPSLEEPLTPISDELASFIDLALKNNQPTQVATEEIKFAQLKVVEAERTFLPALKLQGYNTTGEVYKLDYEEREAKLQADQPLFYGGRLINTLKQAKVNLEVTQKNYDRLKFDVMYKTETAYCNLIAGKINLQQKQAVYQEAKQMLETIKKLSDAEMVIPLELASATTWFNQIAFQIDSIKQDLFMAELTFKQVLNVKETPEIQAQSLGIKKLDLDLDKCLELAYQNRPEIYLSELLVKFSDYGQKIEANKKNAFTVDFTGSYGKYEGHYKTEPWKKADNWYAGIKVSKPWGANTLNSSYSSEESQPRFGQTSPTASQTLSAEFNLLDNMTRLSDKKRADIDLKRSLSDFNETLKTITFEVQDAFLNYQKAVLQLNTTEGEMKFRRNEVEVAKVRAMVGEADLSNAMEALSEFSEAQTRYIQALANYQLSLATLKKATGYGLKI